VQLQEQMFKKKKGNWPSTTALGLQGWVIKVIGDQQ